MRQVASHQNLFGLRQRAGRQQCDLLALLATRVKSRFHIYVSLVGCERFTLFFIRRSFSRAWCSRDFTVPTEQSSTVAISSSEASSKNRSKTTCRCFSGGE